MAFISGDQPKHHDQFFTKPSVAAALLNSAISVLGDLSHFSLILEPSAGNGAFFLLLPETTRVGIDIDACDGSPLHKLDFLSVEPSHPVLRQTPAHNILVLGNPPFGRRSGTAIRFVNHAFGIADTVCFVLPRSFSKEYIQRSLRPRTFHLLHSEPVPKNAFDFLGQMYDVPCVFQIWRRGETPRPIFRAVREHADFSFSSPDAAAFAIQRIGKRAGRIKTDDVKTLAVTSYYFILPHAEHVLERMRSLDLEHAAEKYKTAGTPSINQVELVRLYSADERRERNVCLCAECVNAPGK